MKISKYWSLKTKSKDTAELFLYEEISSWSGQNSCGSAKKFTEDIDALGDIKTLNIYINSPGGDVFEGTSIYNFLIRLKCIKNVYIDGMAASIASVIAIAGDKVSMPDNSMMMIHNVWSYCVGNAARMRKAAEDIDKYNDNIKTIYLQRTKGKISPEKLTELMDNETWLSAKECLEYGFCDEVTEAIKMSACIKNQVLLAYNHVPEIFLQESEPIIDKEIEALLVSTRNLIKIMEETE